MEGILKDESVIMTFKKRGDELVPSHQAHDYLYRAKELEDECLFSFHERYQTVSCAKAEDMESFHFTEEHVFHDSRVVVSRGSKIAIPVFHFRWVGYPKDFITPLSTRSVAGDADYELKEQYCLRMMILFYPYRSLDDLILNDCHQDAFMAAMNTHAFTEDSLERMQNIVDLLNSIDSSTMPENGVTMVTEDPDPPPEGAGGSRNDDGAEDWMGEVAAFMAINEVETEKLTEEARSFNIDRSSGFPTAGGESNEPLKTRLSECIPEVGTVFRKMVTEDSDGAPPDEDMVAELQNGRSTTSKRALFTLFSTCHVVDGVISDGIGAGHAPHGVQTVKAIGTAESIVAWGESKGLDAEQQIAFEIMAAHFVRSYVLEAEDNLADHEMDERAFIAKCLEDLNKLARREMMDGRALKMFITGPAGSGKCKCVEYVTYTSSRPLITHLSFHLCSCYYRRYHELWSSLL
jgi:hypothetical protein